MEYGGIATIEPTIESGAVSSGRRRVPVRTVILVAVAVALLMPFALRDGVPSVVALAVTAGTPEPLVEVPPPTVVDEPTTTTVVQPSVEPTTTTAPRQVVSGPASTTTTAARTVVSPTTTVAKSTASSSVPLPLPTTPFTLPPVSVPPPSPSVTLFPLPTPGSQPMGIVSGPDGNLWFTESNRDVVGRITPQGAITEFPTPTKGSQPTVITVGPDRNLWFTEVSGNKVARMTTSGAVTEYAIPTAYGYPLHGITSGPDGAVWFTEWNAGKVARVDLAGQVTEFAAGTDTPGFIVAGRDGNLWYTGSGGALWRMSPSGSTSPVAVGDLTGVWALTVDRAGNLWYAGSNPEAGRVGRRDAAGRLTEFTIPGRDMSFNGIAEAPDGAIWLTQGARNTIIRLALDGTMTTFSAPSPMRITAGPDGNMWFTSGTNGNAIGKVGVA
jgi:virginiamycin B lyase